MVRHSLTVFSLLLTLTHCASGIAPADGGDAGSDAPITTDTPRTPIDPVRGELALNDVSILFPLPTTSTMDRLFGVDTVGGRGVLIPDNIFNALPALSLVRTDNVELRPLLRVISARIDPCFRDTIDMTASCRRQIRLVMQPLWRDIQSADGTYGEDMAIHLFYDLDDNAFRGLIADLASLHARTPELQTNAPLGVHPALAARGLASPFADELRTALLSRIGAQNLTRVATMSLGEMRNQWSFASFDVVNNSTRPVPITGVTMTSEHIEARVPDGGVLTDDLQATFNATPVAADDLRVLMHSADAHNASPIQRQVAVRAALRIENPSRHAPGTIDCVSCHVATNARHWAERTFAIDTTNDAERFRSTLDLTSTSEVTPDRTALRAFGWARTERAISQRTINETAAVVEELRRNWLRAP